jgi:hypothetical protein
MISVGTTMYPVGIIHCRHLSTRYLETNIIVIIAIIILKSGLGGVDWIGLAQDRDKWRALVNVVRTFGFQKMQGNYPEATQPVGSRVVLSYI